MTLKRIFNLIVFTLFCALSFAQRHPSELSFPEEEFSPPRAQKFVLENGITVFLVEDRELPRVSFKGIFRAGSIYDPTDKVGLADLATASIRAGGTKSAPPDVLDDELEHRAVSLWLGAGGEMLSADLTTLKKHLDWAIKTYADVLLNPAFRNKYISLERKKAEEDIRRRWDYPHNIASLNFRKIVYGEDNPWGRWTTLGTLKKISRNDIVKFHQNYFVPNNFILGVYGDFDTQEMLALIRDTFGSWERREVSFPDAPKIEDNLKRQVYYIPKTDLKQTHIYIGHLGFRRHDPDEIKIRVMNHILSGGFSSRLFYKVRSEKGLAYSVWGGVWGGTDRGSFAVNCQTKPESTVAAIETIFSELDRLRIDPPEEDEMTLAKRSTINSFVFQFEDSADVLWKSISNFYYGYPDDYWDAYLDLIREVGAEDVLNVAKKHIDPEKFIILVVGNEEKFDKPLSTLGDVIQITLE